MSQNRDLQLRQVVQLLWSQELLADVDDTSPGQDAGAFETAGPRNLPRRPRLEPNVGPGGMVARVLGTDGQPQPLAVLPDAADPLIRLSGPPLSLAARRDGGLWSLERDRLHHLSASGARKGAVEITGVCLIGALDDATWVVDLDVATLVRADGHIEGAYPFRGVPGAIGWKGMVCSLEQSDPRRVHCVDADGRSSFPWHTSTNFAPGPFERLLTIGEGVVLTSTTDTLRMSGFDGLIWELSILGAGVTAGGKPFLSTVDVSAVALWIGGSATARLLPLAPAGLDGHLAAVVAVDGERTLLWGGDRAAWYRGEAVERVFVVDDATYRQEIFPLAWQVPPPFPFAAGREGRLLIPVSGSSGLGIIELRLADPG